MQHRQSKVQRRLVVSGLALLLWGTVISETHRVGTGSLQWGAAPAIAQDLSRREIRRLSSREVAPYIYEQLPDLPLENEYIRQDNNEIATDNTLINRLIQYHINVKQRPIPYRLDWKLTLADYLGVNEAILPSRYPGADILKTNPLEGDRAAIRNLTRSQRDALVQALTDLFTPPSTASESDSRPNPAPRATPAPTSNPPAVERSPSSRPSAADLLLPE